MTSRARERAKERFPSRSPIQVKGGWFYENSGSIDVVSTAAGPCRIPRKTLQRYLNRARRYRAALARNRKGKP